MAEKIVIEDEERVELAQHVPGDLAESVCKGDEIKFEEGVWIFRSGAPLSASTTDRLMEDLRDERDDQNGGRGL
jgi:hypothetical protein